MQASSLHPSITNVVMKHPGTSRSAVRPPTLYGGPGGFSSLAGVPGVEPLARAAPRAQPAPLAVLPGKPRHNHRQILRRQRLGVVPHRQHGEVPDVLGKKTVEPVELARRWHAYAWKDWLQISGRRAQQLSVRQITTRTAAPGTEPPPTPIGGMMGWVLLGVFVLAGITMAVICLAKSCIF